MKRFTTTRKALGFNASVCMQDGSLTGYKVFVPYDSPKRFSLGHLEFDVRVSPQGKHFAYAQDVIPQSWFVDLNGVE
jgi:hypothetical protein